MTRIPKKSISPPIVGIIMLDTSFPRIKGDIGNPDTFNFPVLYKVVKDASPARIVLQADKSLIQPFIEAGLALIREGAKLITTSCGFLALFHNELTDALNVPVFSSSLQQVHMAQSIIGENQKVGIITAHKPSLTQKHLAAIGIAQYEPEIIGMEACDEFSSVFLGGKQSLDAEECGLEMRRTTLKFIQSHPDIGAIVLECTNMPPYSHIVHQASGGLPIFDIVTMMNAEYSIVSSK